MRQERDQGDQDQDHGQHDPGQDRDHELVAHQLEMSLGDGCPGDKSGHQGDDPADVHGSSSGTGTAERERGVTPPPPGGGYYWAALTRIGLPGCPRTAGT